MPASFYFAKKADHQHIFKIPERAFQTLGRTNYPNLDKFFFPLTPPLPGQPPLPPRRLGLGDRAVLMCGTYGDLLGSLTVMNQNHQMDAFNVEPGSRLCVHHVQIRNSQDLTTRTLICLASLEQWWDVPNYVDIGTARAFDSIPANLRQNLQQFRNQMLWIPLLRADRPFRGISMDDLIRCLAPTANTPAWMELSVPRWGQPS